MEKIYKVTNPSGNVSEHFNCRQSAIDFIIDEFSMALGFRTDNEGERLAEYMLTHNETPNQYPYKYLIEEIKVNTEYDRPKPFYLVKVDCVESCMQKGNVFPYKNYEDAREHFDNIVDEDIKKNSKNSNVESGLNSVHYERWFTNENYCVEHLEVELIEVVEKDGKFVKKC